MTAKSLFNLASVCAALVAAWLAVRHFQGRPSEARLGPGLAGGDIRKLVIMRQGTRVVMAEEGSGWRVREPFRHRADAAAVREFLARVPGVRLIGPLSENPGKHARFQVDPSSGIRVQIFKAAAGPVPDLDFYAGTSGMDYDSTYLRKEGSAEVYEGKGLARAALDRSPEEWADRTILEIPKDQVRSLWVRRAGRTVRLALKSGVWQVEGATAPLASEKVSEVLEPLLGGLARFQADRLVLSKPKPEWGLDRPGLELGLRASPVAPDPAKPDAQEASLEDIVLAVGAKDEAGMHYMKRSKEAGAVYLVSDWKLEPFRKLADLK